MILLTILNDFRMDEATWALLGVVIGGFLTGVINYFLQRAQFKHNKDMFYLQNQSKEQVKEILEELLNHRRYTDRSFESIRKRIGGYSEVEIRQMLHEIGAKKSSRQDGLGEW
ncbi:hypothetical protein OAD66_02530 [Bacteroidia bacterium]|nr:hypothetical protein [Bacteroidia bacterium]MDB9881989.1 hypothetical protein [Bacteroidia bacterium]